MCLELYFEGSLLIPLVSDVTSCLGYFTASRHDRNTETPPPGVWKTRLMMNSFPVAWDTFALVRELNWLRHMSDDDGRPLDVAHQRSTLINISIIIRLRR